jgi:hypothetical protein
VGRAIILAGKIAEDCRQPATVLRAVGISISARPQWCAEEHASIPTTHGASSAKKGTSRPRVSLRATTISPFLVYCVNLKHVLRQIETNPRDSRQIPDRLADGRRPFRWGFDKRPSWHAVAVRGTVHPIIPACLRIDQSILCCPCRPARYGRITTESGNRRYEDAPVLDEPIPLCSSDPSPDEDEHAVCRNYDRCRRWQPVHRRTVGYH